MEISKNDIYDIFNKLRDEIVSFDIVDNRKKLEKFLVADSGGRKDNVFVRRSPVPVSLLIYYLMRHNPVSSQISIEEFFDQIDSSPVSKSAISQRRSRLSPDIFKYLNRILISECYNKAGETFHKWHGWHLIACDGSQLSLPDTDSVAKEFRRYHYRVPSGRAGLTFPMTKCLMISDVLNQITLCGALYPHNADERQAYLELLPEFVNNAPFNLKQTICLLDRGYYSLKLMQDIANSGMKYVVRVQLTPKVVRNFIACGKSEEIIEWLPSENTSLGRDADWKNRGSKPIKIRLVRVKLKNGEIEVLATNLTSEQVSACDMNDLYSKRWGIEIDYLHYKHVYEIEAFTGARPICIHQDFYAVMLCHNLVSLLIDSQKAAVQQRNLHKKLKYQTNTAIFVGIFFLGFNEMMILGQAGPKIDYLLEAATSYLTPIKNNRSYPRRRKKHKSSDRNLTRTNRKRVY